MYATTLSVLKIFSLLLVIIIISSSIIIYNLVI